MHKVMRNDLSCRRQGMGEVCQKKTKEKKTLKII